MTETIEIYCLFVVNPFLARESAIGCGRQLKRIISAAVIERIADTKHAIFAINAGVDPDVKEPPRTPSDSRALMPKKSYTQVQGLSMDADWLLY